MNTENLEHFKLLFSTMKDQLLQKATAQLELEGLKAGDIVDQSTNERDIQLLLRLQGRERLFLNKIDTALEKIENKTFGECEECGCSIGLSRLHARPTASFCIGCKEEMEREETQISYAKRSKSNGKSLNNSYQNVSFLNDDEKMKEDQIANLDDWKRKQNAGVSQRAH